MSGFKASPGLRARPVVGMGMDIPTGRFLRGKHGEYILNGGMSNFIGVGGRGNSYKTLMSIYCLLKVLSDILVARGHVFDAESTAELGRLYDLINNFPGLTEDDIDQNDPNEAKLFLTDASVMNASEWWDALVQFANERRKNYKKLAVDTPFVDKEGNYYTMLPPYLTLADSVSAMMFDAVEGMLTQKSISDSSNQTYGLRGNNDKNKMVIAAPQITNRGGINLMMTTHLGDKFKLDPYAPDTKKLAFMANGVQFKDTPEKFTFMTTQCWTVLSTKPCWDPSNNKTPRYPSPNYPDTKEHTDLMEVKAILLRNKSGPSGVTVTWIISQAMGPIPYLTEYNMLRYERKNEFERWFEGSATTKHNLILYPEVKVGRTTVRDIADEDHKFQRAAIIEAELAQMFEWQLNLDKRYKVYPRELYDKLKEQGHDWNVLLETRHHWVPVQEESSQERFPLSTFDLLRMYNEEYIPYWYTDEQRAKIKYTPVDPLANTEK